MALDPQAKAFLDRMASFNAPDISEAGAFLARSGSHGEPDLSGPLDPSVRIDHRFFTSSTADTYIKVYTPAGSGPFNGLVWFISMVAVGLLTTSVNMMRNAQR